MTKDKSNVYKKTFKLKKVGRGKPTFNHEQFYETEYEFSTSEFESKEAAVTPLKGRAIKKAIEDMAAQERGGAAVTPQESEIDKFIKKIRSPAGVYPTADVAGNATCWLLAELAEAIKKDLGLNHD